MRRPPNLFYLKQSDQLLGLVHVLSLWDMFVFKVRFEPTENFSVVAPLFDKAIKALDYGGPGEIYEIWDEIIAQGVVLVRADDGTVIDSFMLHIDGEHSRLGYLDPSELEGLDTGRD